MKKLLIIVITGLLFASCEKDEPDYREKFVGKYECVVDYYSFNAPSGYSRAETYLDTIEVGMIEDSSLTFHSEKKEHLFKGNGYNLVDNDGNFEFLIGDETKLRGQFFNDSIICRLGYSHHGIFGYVYHFKGKKLKK